MYTIVTTPNPILIQNSADVKRFDKKLRDLLSEMKKTLLATVDPKGVGLAAPQVGISKRLFLAKPTDKAKILVIINPRIIKQEEIPQKKSTKKRLLEGCLSIPNIWGKVTRSRQLTLEYQDEHGKKHEKIFKGFLATIVQHEIDHLNGILFTKHVIEQGEKLYRSYKNGKGEDEFEEIKV